MLLLLLLVIGTEIVSKKKRWWLLVAAAGNFSLLLLVNTVLLTAATCDILNLSLSLSSPNLIVIRNNSLLGYSWSGSTRWVLPDFSHHGTGMLQLQVIVVVVVGFFFFFLSIRSAAFTDICFSSD